MVADSTNHSNSGIYVTVDKDVLSPKGMLRCAQSGSRLCSNPILSRRIDCSSVR